MSDFTRKFPRIADDTCGERDAWINKYFPKRTCTNIPGVFDIPGTDLHLQVFCESVHVWSEKLEQIEHDELEQQMFGDDFPEDQGAKRAARSLD